MAVTACPTSVAGSPGGKGDLGNPELTSWQAHNVYQLAASSNVLADAVHHGSELANNGASLDLELMQMSVVRTTSRRPP